MLNGNIDVKNCQANGTQAKICQIVLNRGVTPFLVSVDGIMVRGAFALQVNHLRLEHVGNPGKFFNVESKKFTGMTVKMPVSTELSSRRFPHVELKMKGSTQFPIMINNATTCHKLQGCTKHAIFVNKFDYRSNWPYVVLSCVKTHRGLYLRRPLLASRHYYGVHPSLHSMREHFRATKKVSDDWYDING
jgi:hypothetical protein